MRNPLTLLLLLSLLPAYAQELVVPPGATWNYNGQRWEHLGGSEVMVLAPFVGQVECTGTEVVQGRPCSVLAPSAPTDPISDWCNYVPTYLTRSNDTVYYLNGLDSEFHTFYVLNTPIGGSWTSPNPFDPQGGWYDVTWTVLDTGTILVDGVALRQLAVVSDEGILGTLTERIGFHQFPTPWNWGMMGGCDIGNLDDLRCYADDEISWKAPGYTECWPQDPDAGIVHFDDPANVWYVARTFPAASPQFPAFAATRTTRYFYDGTITADGVTWKNLYAEPTWEDDPTATLQGHIYQNGGLVWFRDTLGNIDTLYNFNLHVGDSVYYPDIGLLDPYLTIEAIDTVMIQDHPHRRFRFSEDWVILEAYYSDIWIEGIGSRSGPLAPRVPWDLSTGTGFPDSTRTTCFLQGPDLLWQHPGYTSCTTNIIMGMEGPPTPDVRLYPNPAAEVIHLENLPAGRWSYQLADIMGRTWIQGELTGTEDRQQIKVGPIPAGSYLLRLEGPSSMRFTVVKE